MQDYLVLVAAFSIGLGLFNTFLTLIFQFVEPYGYGYIATSLSLHHCVVLFS